MEVMSFIAFKRERIDKKYYKLSFTEKDMVGVDTPHNDALVLTIHISTFEVNRILIDIGSSSKIMYNNLFKKLNLPPSQVKEADMPVFSFSGKEMWPIAIAKVLVRIGEVQKINC